VAATLLYSLGGEILTESSQVIFPKLHFDAELIVAIHAVIRKGNLGVQCTHDKFALFLNNVHDRCSAGDSPTKLEEAVRKVLHDIKSKPTPEQTQSLLMTQIKLDTEARDRLVERSRLLRGEFGDKPAKEAIDKLHTKIKNSGKYAKASALHKKLLLVSGPELVAGIDERIEIITRTIAQMEKLMEMWA